MVSVVGYMFGVFVCSFSDDMNVIKCLSFWDFYMMFKISFTNKWLTTFLYCFLSLQVSPVFPVLVVSKNKNKKSQTKSKLAWLCCSAPQIYFPSVHFWCKRVFPLWIEMKRQNHDGLVDKMLSLLNAGLHLARSVYKYL